MRGVLHRKQIIRDIVNNSEAHREQWQQWISNLDISQQFCRQDWLWENMGFEACKAHLHPSLSGFWN